MVSAGTLSIFSLFCRWLPKTRAHELLIRLWCSVVRTRVRERRRGPPAASATFEDRELVFFHGGAHIQKS